MKKLTLFQTFNFPAFQAGKKFVIQTVKFNEKRGCVTISVVITEDKTDYGDSNVSNLFEKFNVHLINDRDENAVNRYHIGDEIIFKSIGKCTVWGDYGSQLSVEAEVTKK